MKQVRHFSVGPEGILIGCNVCKKTKGSLEFYVKYRNEPQTNLSHWQEKCIDCAKKYRTKHYQKNSKTINLARKADYYANHEKYRLQRSDSNLAKNKDKEHLLGIRRVRALGPTERYLHDRCKQWKAMAQRRGLPWKIEAKWVQEQLNLQDGKCFYTGRPLALAPNKRDTLSLDRVDSTKGYTPSNAVLCGTLINKMKLDMPIEEFAEWIVILHNDALPNLRKLTA